MKDRFMRLASWSKFSLGLVIGCAFRGLILWRAVDVYALAVAITLFLTTLIVERQEVRR